ncbi:uncharacterized protein DS421_1g01230 [Arachis hypogaea]|nr:uncharacterized protein DS421_1g01230 [Arachis hypogaea]
MEHFVTGHISPWRDGAFRNRAYKSLETKTTPFCLLPHLPFSFSLVPFPFHSSSSALASITSAQPRLRQPPSTPATSSFLSSRVFFPFSLPCSH